MARLYQVAAFALLVAVAASAPLPSIQIKEYDAKDCSGTPKNDWTVTTEQCVAPRNQSDLAKGYKFRCEHIWMNSRASKLQAVAAPTQEICATISPDAGDNCTRDWDTINIPCNQCLRGPEAVGNYKYACAQGQADAVVSHGCDEGCNKCNHTATIKIGACEPYDDHGHKHNMKLIGLSVCPTMVFEEAYKNETCGDFPDHMNHFESGRCVDGWEFVCSGVDPEPTHRVASSEQQKVTVPDLVNKHSAAAALAHVDHASLPAAVAQAFQQAQQNKDLAGMQAAMAKWRALQKLGLIKSTFKPWDWVKCEVCKHIIEHIAGVIAKAGCAAADPVIDAACGVAGPAAPACAIAFDAVCETIFELVVKKHTPINSHLCDDIHFC